MAGRVLDVRRRWQLEGSLRAKWSTSASTSSEVSRQWKSSRNIQVSSSWPAIRVVSSPSSARGSRPDKVGPLLAPPEANLRRTDTRRYWRNVVASRSHSSRESQQTPPATSCARSTRSVVLPYPAGARRVVNWPPPLLRSFSSIRARRIVSGRLLGTSILVMNAISLRIVLARPYLPVCWARTHSISRLATREPC